MSLPRGRPPKRGGSAGGKPKTGSAKGERPARGKSASDTTKSETPRRDAPKRAPAAGETSASKSPGRSAVKGGTPKRGTPAEPMRVQRAVARAGLASRREADRLVAEGRIRVNGIVAVIGQVIDPSRDKITLDGNSVAPITTTNKWVVLNKPSGVMTTRRDPEGRETVFDLVEDIPGLTYVGRLDFLTEGVLLLTTDGLAAHALTHPSGEIERTYVATVKGDAATAVKQARRGVQLDDGLVVPRDVSATPAGQRRWFFEITIAEGKTHEVRRLCAALGLEVERLVRTRFGPVRLGDLPSGSSRALSPRERSVLEALVPAR